MRRIIFSLIICLLLTPLLALGQGVEVHRYRATLGHPEEWISDLNVADDNKWFNFGERLFASSRESIGTPENPFVVPMQVPSSLATYGVTMNVTTRTMVKPSFRGCAFYARVGNESAYRLFDGAYETWEIISIGRTTGKRTPTVEFYFVGRRLSTCQLFGVGFIETLNTCPLGQYESEGECLVEKSPTSGLGWIVAGFIVLLLIAGIGVNKNRRKK